MFFMDEKPYQLREKAREPVVMNQIPRPEGRGMLFSRCGCTQEFNTFLTALKGGVLNHFGTNKNHCMRKDYLNTHAVSSLYETLSAEEAYSPAQGLEIHYTPNTTIGLLSRK